MREANFQYLPKCYIFKLDRRLILRHKQGKCIRGLNDFALQVQQRKHRLHILQSLSHFPKLENALNRKAKSRSKYLYTDPRKFNGMDI